MVELGDSREILPTIPDKSFDLVLADPPYEDPELLNLAITEGRRISKGATLVFMYPEDVCLLETKPEQICHWVKPVSTKNTIKKYSRFVEVLCVWHGPFFNQGLHWSSRTGVFTDHLIVKPVHPHGKPESLIETLIRLHAPPVIFSAAEFNTHRPKTILDPFAGSGTVERVGTRLGYRVRSIEKDPKWIR